MGLDGWVDWSRGRNPTTRTPRRPGREDTTLVVVVFADDCFTACLSAFSSSKDFDQKGVHRWMGTDDRHFFFTGRLEQRRRRLLGRFEAAKASVVTTKVSSLVLDDAGVMQGY